MERKGGKKLKKWNSTKQSELVYFSSNVVRFRLTDSMLLSSCSVTIEMQFADSRHGDFSTKKKDV